MSWGQPSEKKLGKKTPSKAGMLLKTNTWKTGVVGHATILLKTRYLQAVCHYVDDKDRSYRKSRLKHHARHLP